MPVAELRRILITVNADFRDKAPVTAAEAATVILDGVRAGAWRILIGKDAAQLDAFVRANPDATYDYAEMRKSFQAGGTQGRSGGRGVAASVRLAEQVPGDPGQVGAHRLDRGVRVACPEGGDDGPVVFLVELPPLPGRAAALEVAPDLAVPGRLDDAVQRDEQRAVRGRR